MTRTIFALLLTTMVTASTAFAGPAVVTKGGPGTGDQACALTGPGPFKYFVDEDAKVTQVETNNNKGTSKVTCTGNLPDPSLAPKKAQVYTPENSFRGCTVNGVETTDYHAVVTPSGKAHLVCILHSAP